MPDWILAEGTTASTSVQQLQTQLRAEQETNLLLTESMADLQLALEDKGWIDIAGSVQRDFTPDARRALMTLCRTMAISNPLIKRGLQIRIGYVWGQGVEVRARAGSDADQDVNAVVQKFWDANGKTLTSNEAHELLERGAATDGDVFVVCFTSPLTGGVRTRTALSEEIVDIINNPEDREDPWFYVRHVPQKITEPGVNGARTRQQIAKVVHPALSYRPQQRPKSLDGMPIRWDAPIKHIKVNPVQGWRFGVPDVYASIAWARAYKDFLVDWAQLTKSLSKYAWLATGGTSSRAQKMAREIARTNGGGVGPVPPVGAAGASQAGQAAVGTPDVKLEAISKSGATIDANSGKPLAGMAAAGMGLPVTMLLADPGVTGARAVAETLDLPTILEMGMRRLLWQSAFTDILEYVIDQAVLAPRGALRGTLSRDEWGQLNVILAGENVEKTIEWEWPALVDVDPIELIKAIVEASDSTIGKAIPLVMLRLVLNALGVKDADEVLEQVTDEEGNWVDPTASAGSEAVRRFRDGQDPASTLNPAGD
jgi:hypothetical protein